MSYSLLYFTLYSTNIKQKKNADDYVLEDK